MESQQGARRSGGAGFKVQRSRIHAIAQAGGCGAIFKDMSQVGTALCTHRLRADHAVAAIHDFRDRTRDGFGKAGPAAASVEFGHGIEQLRASADAVVAAVGPMGFVFAGEGALGGGVSRDLQCDGLRPLVAQDGLPFGLGFLDGVGHDEQLMAMEDAQSGGKAA